MRGRPRPLVLEHPRDEVESAVAVVCCEGGERVEQTLSDGAAWVGGQLLGQLPGEFSVAGGEHVEASADLKSDRRIGITCKRS